MEQEHLIYLIRMIFDSQLFHLSHAIRSECDYLHNVNDVAVLYPLGTSVI